MELSIVSDFCQLIAIDKKIFCINCRYRSIAISVWYRLSRLIFDVNFYEFKSNISLLRLSRFNKSSSMALCKVHTSYSCYHQANLILFNQQYHAMPIRSPFCGWMGFLKLRSLQASVPLLAPPPPALWSILLSLQFVRSQNAGKLFVLELLLCRLTERGLKCPGSTYESSPLVAIFRRCELVIFLIPISCLVNKVLKL